MNALQIDEGIKDIYMQLGFYFTPTYKYHKTNKTINNKNRWKADREGFLRSDNLF